MNYPPKTTGVPQNDPIVDPRDADIRALRAEVERLRVNLRTGPGEPTIIVCDRCLSTPYKNDATWRGAGDHMQHRCDDVHPLCGHDFVPPIDGVGLHELLAKLRARIAALEAERVTAEDLAEAIKTSSVYDFNYRPNVWARDAFTEARRLAAKRAKGVDGDAR